MDMTMARHDLDAEYDRIHLIVARHAPPEFVKGFEIAFTDNDGMPAVWITFKTVGDPTSNNQRLKDRAKQMVDYRSRIQDDLLREVREWYPYFSSAPFEDRAAS